MLESPFNPIHLSARSASASFSSKVVIALLPALLLTLTGCASVNARYSPAKPHHTAEGFKNNYIGAIDKSFGELIRWQRERHAAVRECGARLFGDAIGIDPEQANKGLIQRGADLVSGHRSPRSTTTESLAHRRSVQVHGFSRGRARAPEV